MSMSKQKTVWLVVAAGLLVGAGRAGDYNITAQTAWNDQRDVPGDIVNLTVLKGAELLIGGGAYEPAPIVVAASGKIKVEAGGKIMVIGEVDPKNFGAGYPAAHGHTLKARELEVAAGGWICGDGAGYPAELGPGVNGDDGGYNIGYDPHGGAGYGGSGFFVGWAFSLRQQYGSCKEPLDLGSSGAYSIGGGAIRLMADETLTVNGRISCNGFGMGGSSGGSVYITCGALAGAGRIEAQGDAGLEPTYGSGGGGRIALDYKNNAFQGVVSVAGGKCGPTSYGDPGTVWYPDNFDDKGLVVAEGGFGLGPGNYTMGPLTVKSNAVLMLHAYNGEIATIQTPKLVVEAGGKLVVGGDPKPAEGRGCVINADEAEIAGEVTSFQEGFPCLRGPGTGGPFKAASHGGRGGDAEKPPYGSAEQPVSLGSGGAVTPGGGAIRLIVKGALKVMGKIASDGGPGNSNGAAGGSVYINCGALSGAGVISANGGRGGYDGGGGGRIAVYYSASDSFTGALAAQGGIGSYKNGADGTVVKRQAQ